LSSDREEGCEHSNGEREDVHKIVPYFAPWQELVLWLK
jgi:hypothetical protein